MPTEVRALEQVWSSRLGLLPVPLLESAATAGQFVMLNGSQGNFILDVSGRNLVEDARSVAWSANVGHHVKLVDRVVEVQRWDSPSNSLERYSQESVLSDLERFHQYLERTAPRSDLSVVSHGVRIFRRLRAALGASFSGSAALEAYLVLLAAASEHADLTLLDTRKWGVGPRALEVAGALTRGDWSHLIKDLLIGRPVEQLQLQLPVLLRHAAGLLFQEAHYEAVFLKPEQLHLGIAAPAPVEIRGGSSGIGLHFTPPMLARALVEECLSRQTLTKSELTVFDPACGSGEFLREVLRQLELRGYRKSIHIIGWDISEAACSMATFVLSWEKRATGERLKFDVSCTDALSPATTWPRNVDLVIMNPPFVSWQDMAPDRRERVKELLGPIAKQRPDMASAFLWASASCLAPAGVLGSILPASLLSNSSSDALRSALSRRLRTNMVARLGSHMLFPSALVDAAFYVASNDSTAAIEPLAVWADHRSTSTSAAFRALRKLRSFGVHSVAPVVGDGFSVYPIVEAGHPDRSWAPRPYEQWSLLSSIERIQRSTVQEVFGVHQGARTGDKRTFILDRSEWMGLPKRERKYFRPAVLNASIRDGVLCDDFYAFYPYGEMRIPSERELKEVVPRYFEKWLSVRRDLLTARADLSAGKWWEHARSRKWQEVSEPKIVSTYFGGQGSFSWDARGDFVVVQGFAWLPKGKRHADERAIQTAHAYTALLNSGLVAQLLAALSNHVAGGQWDLSPRFLNEMPLPNLFRFESNESLVGRLAELGNAITSVGLKQLNAVQRGDLEETVRAAYGLGGQA